MSTEKARGGAAKEAFSGRTMFIFAAIGSAVGLGNIWRFPYVAFDNGGGAFIIPYLVALLTAGIPLLMLDYAIGHRYRGSAPLSFRRLHPKLETIGWWQLSICVVIAIYYALIIGWAMQYTVFSFSKAWGDDPSSFFMKDYMKVSDTVTIGFDFIWPVFIATAIAWLVLLVVLMMGVQNGIGKLNVVLIPLLVLMFLIMVGMALTLPGASAGLDALFTPSWDALGDSSVWVAAYGQIFFSLSVGFGIMVTYASYLKPRSDLSGSALVVGFANSSFELLAGIGVFAALGFMATASGTQVADVATSGIGLAFIAFPAIISQAPFGTLIGVLFFGALAFAGFTSLISIVEVIVAGVRDKLGLSRPAAVALVVLPLAAVSLLFFPTTTGLNLLDVVDAFVNNFGIVAAALMSVLLLTSGFTALPTLRDHINSVSSFKLGRTWMIMAGGVTPVILGYILIDQLTQTVAEGYNDMPQWFVNVFGWGMAVGLIVISYLLSKLPWSRRTSEAFTSPAPSVQDAYLDRKALAEQRSLTHYPDTAGRTAALDQDFSLRAIDRGTVVQRTMPWSRTPAGDGAAQQTASAGTATRTSEGELS
ncbi:neurotransmitter:Na+ symporter, NSS family [Kocuria rhizophila]|uniref:sodium-dependent transporter n=1 Tax=Kocuria rhizophila TaxID=72000 RepID=UPI00190B69FE|nr:sodium-dependent transporter [Kocuria rhizophila]MBK4120941.1 sodium-dependent transporter [Kocuria rhizophila]